jgi:hypothetical protein
MISILRTGQMWTFPMQSELPSRLGFSDAEADHKPAGPCVPFSKIFSFVDLLMSISRIL